MCGIIALYSQDNCAQTLYQGLMHLQHRGQDAAGISTLGDRLYVKRGKGRVDEVFTSDELDSLQGSVGIGHTRYATSGCRSEYDIQPFSDEGQYGISLAHSGHLSDSPWMSSLENKKLSSLVDSNLLLAFLVDLLKDYPFVEEENDFFSLICQVVQTLFNSVPGAYSIVSLVAGKGLLVFRDPQGIRPLVMSERCSTSGTKSYLFASESHFFSEFGFNEPVDLRPGEVVWVTLTGQLFRKQLTQKKTTPCSFEYVYFAHKDSTMNGVSVTESRHRMGHILAQRWNALHPKLTPDCVVPIPNTANTAASFFAQSLGFHYQDYFAVDKRLGRTFIQPSAKERCLSVSKKLSINPKNIKNKKILLFDDSIVRGTTATHAISYLRTLGAKKIYFVSACPPLVNTCSYGINIPTVSELIAANNSMEAIKKLLGCDELLYPQPHELITAINGRSAHQEIEWCLKCMNAPS